MEIAEACKWTLLPNLGSGIKECHLLWSDLTLALTDATFVHKLVVPLTCWSNPRSFRTTFRILAGSFITDFIE